MIILVIAVLFGVAGMECLAKFQAGDGQIWWALAYACMAVAFGLFIGIVFVSNF